jgi:hypothetical protein
MKNIKNKSIVLGQITLAILAVLALGLTVSPDTTFALTAYGTNAVYYQPPVSNPVPSIDSITPKSSNVGVGTKTITIVGSGFVPSSVARVNGSNRPTTFIDNSHLLTQISGNDTYVYRTNGGFYITVYNGAPDGGYSNAAFFTVNNTVPSPDANANVNNGNGYNSATSFNDSYNNSGTRTNYTTDTFVDTNTANSNGNNLASAAILGSNTFLPSGLLQWVLFGIIVMLIIILVRKIFGATDRYHEAPLKHD